MSPIDRRLLTHLNWPLFGLLLILFSVGILNLYSASGYRMEEGVILNAFYKKQFLWGLIGLGGLLVFMFVNYRYLRTLAWPIYVVTVLLLLAVPMWGKVVMGAKRWLDFRLFNFQPSEAAKISILLIGARILSNGQGKLDFGELLYILAIGLIPTGLVIVQPDLGSGLNLLLLLGGLILYRGLTPRVFKTLLVVVPTILPLGWFFLHDYQKRRILSFMNPENDPKGSGYHILQSLIAIGSGKIWGKGFMAGTQSQYRFLPERHTDFAAAVLGEEWGLAGNMALLALFSLFLYTVYMTARDARDRFGSFLAAGVFFYFFWQIFINLGMVLGMMPVVGIPLPFISYGGSATLVNFCLVGLVLNVSMRRFSANKDSVSML